MACPHTDIRFCPLYVASHDASNGYGCDDGRLGEGGCAVDRGLDYGATVAKLRAVAPRLVAIVRFNEDAEKSRRQRARNMRAAGVH